VKQKKGRVSLGTQDLTGYFLFRFTKGFKLLGFCLLWLRPLILYFATDPHGHTQTILQKTLALPNPRNIKTRINQSEPFKELQSSLHDTACGGIMQRINNIFKRNLIPSSSIAH